MKGLLNIRSDKVPGTTIVEASFRTGLYAAAAIFLLLLPVSLSIAPLAPGGVMLAIDIAIVGALVGAVLLAIVASVLNVVRALAPVPLAALLSVLPYLGAAVVFGPNIQDVLIRVQVGDAEMMAPIIPIALVITVIFFFVLRRKLAALYD